MDLIAALNEMPEAVDARNAALNRAARECYALRNVAATAQRAADFEAIGDTYLNWALALTEEWLA